MSEKSNYTDLGLGEINMNPILEEVHELEPFYFSLKSPGSTIIIVDSKNAQLYRLFDQITKTVLSNPEIDGSRIIDATELVKDENLLREAKERGDIPPYKCHQFLARTVGYLDIDLSGPSKKKLDGFIDYYSLRSCKKITVFLCVVMAVNERMWGYRTYVDINSENVIPKKDLFIIQETVKKEESYEHGVIAIIMDPAYSDPPLIRLSHI
ncbi:MAG: hypothetical protein WC974_00385 [Thermoplasmata archaeon]